MGESRRFAKRGVVLPQAARRRDGGDSKFGSATWSTLLLLSVLPFGAHFVKNCLSSLQAYIAEDSKVEDFDQTSYGALLALHNLPNMLLPLAGAYLMSTRSINLRYVIVAFPVLVLLGQAIFALGISLGSLTIAGIGCIFVGTGAGCTVMAQRSIAATVFQGTYVTFALGITVSSAAVSKTLARSSVAMVADDTKDVTLTLLYTLLPCALSVLCAVLYAFCALRSADAERVILRVSSQQQLDQRRTSPPRGGGLLLPTAGAPRAAPDGGRAAAGADVRGAAAGSAGGYRGKGGHAEYGGRGGAGTGDPEEGGSGRPGERTPLLGGGGRGAGDPAGSFIGDRDWWDGSRALGAGCTLSLVVLHGLVVNAFHLFAQFAVPILRRRDGYSPRFAGLASALTTVVPVVGAPLAGLLLDRWHGRATLRAIAVGCAFMVAGFSALLCLRSVPPVGVLLLFSALEALLPCAIMSALPLCSSPGRGSAGPGPQEEKNSFAGPRAAPAAGAASAAAAGGGGRPSLLACCAPAEPDLHWAFGAIEMLDALFAIVGSIVIGQVMDRTETFGLGVFTLLVVAVAAFSIALPMAWCAPDRRRKGSRGAAEGAGVHTASMSV